MLDRVAKVLGPFGMGKGVVAVSGGPDSVALTGLLLLLQQQGKLGQMVVAHVNHQLRGAAGDADEAFVVQLARQCGMPCRCQRIDVRSLATASGENLESCARRVRYKFFTEVARAEGAVWVATGHTADDQAETVLHRLFRGTGLQGLGGIRARRPLVPGIDLARPLLQTTRTELLAFLNVLGQPYCQDTTNLDLQFTRNRIRHELLPLLARHYNQGVVSVLCRLADQAQEVQGRIQQEAAQLLTSLELPPAGELVVMPAESWAAAGRHLAREIARLIWQRQGWPMGDMTFADWDRLIDLAAAASGSWDFPGGIRARRTARVVQIGRMSHQGAG